MDHAKHIVEELLSQLSLLTGLPERHQELMLQHIRGQAQGYLDGTASPEQFAHVLYSHRIQLEPRTDIPPEARASVVTVLKHAIKRVERNMLEVSVESVMDRRAPNA